eukprot:TRINITY_DN3778_c0_g2_i3.p1 TRINITY_DN3778_c0_g2~~TRINITY_DN3778_c0_g2_i3.p1  ORF type:complete len:134 (-),score=46.70 TRINITY_DN3778_c0_g2_i3:110-511(-)
MKLKQAHQDYTREYRQQKNIVDDRIESRSLFSTKREYAESDDAVKSMLEKQRQINASIMVAMEIIDSGNNTSNEFKSQHKKMNETSVKLEKFVSAVPELDHIMNKIWCLKSRNNAIIGCTIAVLILVTFLLWK